VVNYALGLIYQALGNSSASPAEGQAYHHQAAAHLNFYRTAADNFAGQTAASIPFDFSQMLAADEITQQGNAGLQAAVVAALEQYSSDFPRTVIEDLTTTDTTYPITFALPARWVVGFSRVINVECPIGYQPVNLLKNYEFAVATEPTQTVLQITARNYPVQVIRVGYTVRHTWETVPAHHQRAVQCLATSIVCENLSTLNAGTTDSLISADGVNRESKTRNFALRAKTLRERYAEITNQTQTPEQQPASAMVNLNSRTGHGRGRMFYRG